MKFYAILFALVVAFSCSSEKQYPIFEESTSHLRDASFKPFYHGVASGDPYPESVVIWTRVTPETKVPAIKGTWEVAEDSMFQKTIQTGDFETDTAKDYTVKIIVDDLQPGTKYFYKFNALGASSVTGTTKIAAENADKVQFAVVSCSNYQFGPFNAYGNIAEIENLDAVIHLGDYIYEYGAGVYGDSTTGRFHLPEHEIVSLEDYRTRYSQYRLDPDLREVHTNHPFITVWDDHEIANNAYKSGAQNHQEEEGDYDERKKAAVQTYYEWIPVRQVDPLYRKFRYGNLVDLIMLDERLAGRTAPAESLEDPTLKDTVQTMLGDEQLQWLEKQLMNSETRWKVIGNQVIFSYLNWGYETFNLNLDSWDGYPYEQNLLASIISEDSIDNVIFVTGDTHSSWAFETTHKPFDKYNPENGAGAYAVELGVTSVNSGNSDERAPSDSVAAHEKRIVNSNINPHLKYANLRDHGYLLLTLNDSSAIAEWHYVESTRERSNKEKAVVKTMVRANSNRLGNFTTVAE
ncbi:hypothetical protein C9994_06575 [Marivirga lumbricoides]|uniref:Alkaline phosphatase n=1 Tax=Marivirga lumbricoides TaxID=1046115 RepID=A0A2T4DS27_9BACT|nr:hypothetical protein C9994_06575 [Marivirga lumbricoides]